MIQCAKCQHLLIGELQKGNVYYRCHSPGCMKSCLKEEIVNEALSRELRKLELTSDGFRFYRDESIRLFGEWKDESEIARGELFQRQQKIKDRQARLIDSYVDGVLEKNEYLERKGRLVYEEQDVRSQMTELGKNVESIPSQFDEFLELANSAYLSFNSASIVPRRDLVQTLTSNFTATGKSVSIKLNNPFELLAERPRVRSGAPYREARRTVSALLSQVLKHFTGNQLSSKNDDLGVAP